METNQEFVPFPKQSQKKNRYEEKDDDDDGNESDKMSDLFPGIYKHLIINI